MQVNRRVKRKTGGFNWNWERAGLGAVEGAAKGFAIGGPKAAVVGGLGGGALGGLTGIDTEADRYHFDEALQLYSNEALRRSRESEAELGAQTGASLAIKGLGGSEMATGIIAANKGRIRRHHLSSINEMAMKNEMKLADIERELVASDRNLTQQYLQSAGDALFDVALAELFPKGKPEGGGVDVDLGLGHGPGHPIYPERPQYTGDAPLTEKEKAINRLRKSQGLPPLKRPELLPIETIPDNPFIPERSGVEDPAVRGPVNPLQPKGPTDVPIEVPRISDPSQDPNQPGLPMPRDPGDSVPRGRGIPGQRPGTLYSVSPDGNTITPIDRDGNPTGSPMNWDGTPVEAPPGKKPVATSRPGTNAAKLEEVIGPDEMSQIRILIPDVDQVLGDEPKLPKFF